MNIITDQQAAKMRMTDGHNLLVHWRAARWQRIRIDRRRWHIMQVILAIDLLTISGWGFLFNVWVRG